MTGFASLDGRTKVWEPLPRQAVALSCPVYELLYGGQKGGGKTDFLVASVIPILQLAADKYRKNGRKLHRCRIVIFRKNLDDLKDIIARTKELYPVLDPEMGEGGYHTNEKVWRFTSGATVELRHLDGPEDHKGYNGQELRAVLFDQVEEIDYEVYAFLCAQVRTTDPDFRPLLMIRSTANPGGRHGDWVYKRFIQPHEAGNKILTETVTLKNGTTREVKRAFVPAALSDNPYLNEDGQYEANLRANLPDHLIKMYLEGDWHVVIGAYFSKRVVPHLHGMTWAEFLDKFPGGVPETGEIRGGLDWGSTNPAALVLGWRDETCDRIYIFDELYGPGDTGSAFGERMHRLFEGQDWNRYKRWAKDEPWMAIDSQAWGKYGSEGMVAADGITSKGFRVYPAQKDRQAGITQWLERLRVRTDGLPGVVIIRDRCPNLWRTLQTVRVCPKNSEDYDRTDEAHAVDAGRFLLMEWQVNTAAPLDPQTANLQSWEKLIAAHQQRERARGEYQGTGYE